MKHYLTVVTAAAVAAASFGFHTAMAGQQNPETALDAGVPWRPTIDFLAIRASRLHLGMTAPEVTAIMGEAAKTANYVDAGTPMQTLEFSTGPIRSKITLASGRLSGVALDVFSVDGDDLPGFTRSAWPGLDSATVRRVLGSPSDRRRHTLFGIEVDQLIFRLPGEPDVSLFFVSDRLVAKRLGARNPSKSLSRNFAVAA
jgi:hypothetical protein